MADSLPVAATATPLPSPANIARAEQFTHERFVHEGEGADTALAPGSARRHALDDALAELAKGNGHPSTEWRRRYSLLLGLERVLSEDEPRLVDGTLLSPHQVDALSPSCTKRSRVNCSARAMSAGEGRGVAAVATGRESAMKGSGV